MKIGITQLIAENIAPQNISNLAIFDGDRKICDVDVSKMRLPSLGNKLFSFGLVSDIHVASDRNEKSTHFDNALTYFEEQGCLFCCHAGDITNVGFWNSVSDTAIYVGHFAEYKRICDLHPNIPVYGITGNHENYNKSILQNLAELEEYTGHPLYYTIQQGNDLFIFIGQPANSSPTMNDEEFAWFKNLLETNTDKRCHVFTHFFGKNDSGSPKNCYFCNFGSHEAEFKTLMANHGKAIHYHGHSHTTFESQTLDEMANYTDKNGFPSVHIPSVGESRDIALQADGTYKRLDREDGDYCSQGYIVDVYENHIVLNGIDFLTEKIIPIGQYCIRV